MNKNHNDNSDNISKRIIHEKRQLRREKRRLNARCESLIESINESKLRMYSENNYSIPKSKSKSYIETIHKTVPVKKVPVKKANIDGIFKFAKYSYRTINRLYYEILEKYYKLKKQKYKNVICDYTFETSMKKLYKESGESIKIILHAVINGDDSLSDLLSDENYSKLKEMLYSFKDKDDTLFEKFRSLLADSVDGSKESLVRFDTKNIEYNLLKMKYEHIPLLCVEANIDVVGIRPEIKEYIRRGYKLVNEEGELIPIDMDILGEIQIELNN